MGHSRKNRRTDFLVQWKGTSEAEGTWERDVTLWQFETTVQAYCKENLEVWWFKLQGLCEEAAGEPDMHRPGAAYPSRVGTRVPKPYAHRGAMPYAPRGISHGRNAMARCYEAGLDKGNKQQAQAMGT
ncbi:hypothetical protein AAG906_019475 [Vitis piasezkii]